MSYLSHQTEHHALLVLARIVLQFEQLHYMNMTKEDDIDAVTARNLLLSIIENNGYRVNYKCNARKIIFKEHI